jgi:hypothetical protein
LRTKEGEKSKKVFVGDLLFGKKAKSPLLLWFSRSTARESSRLRSWSSFLRERGHARGKREREKRREREGEIEQREEERSLFVVVWEKGSAESGRREVEARKEREKKSSEEKSLETISSEKVAS